MIKKLCLVIFILFPPLIIYSFPPPSEFDRNTSREISNLKRYKGVKSLYEGLSFISSTEMMLGYCVVMTAFGDSTMHATGKVATIALASTELTTTLLKIATNRERPSGPTEHRWQSSFPSGHTSSAFSMAYTVGHYYPKLRIPLFILATGVGISRIGIDEHWTTDVIVGAIVGIGCGYITVKFDEKILKIKLAP